MNPANFPITITLIAANCLLSFICFRNQSLMDKLIFHPVSIKENKQYYRYITAGFIHADGQHLLFNMITLFFFGPPLERFFANNMGEAIIYPMFYFIALIVSHIPSYIKHQRNDYFRSLGASGAVSAVTFALILFMPWATIFLKFIIPIPFILYGVGYIAYSIYMDKKGGDNIGHSAHLWGAVFGIAFMLIIYPEVIPIFLEEIKHPRFGVN